MAKKNKPRWKKLDMWERLARRCKQNGASEETVEHIREHGKQRMKEREKIMTVEIVLKNLKELIGNEFDGNDVICAFEDFEEFGETEVIVDGSDNPGYDYIAYINVRESTEFYFTVDEDGIITDVFTDFSSCSF